MSRFALTMPGNWQPSTFLERGVAVPFTTPVIAQARCRPTRRGKVELIVPNPSGGDGNYVLPLAATSDFCTPSLHDQFLLERLETTEHITPGSIRTIASEAALQGFAGRLAAKAAKKRLEEQESELMVNYLILFARTVRAAGMKGANWKNLDVHDPIIRNTTRELINRFAPKIGLSPDRLLDELEHIGRAVVFVGAGEPGTTNSAESQLDQLRHFSGSLRTWHRSSSEIRQLPDLIANAADVTIEQTEKAVSRCRTLTDDIVKLVKAWGRERDKCLELFGLADWMLDGWQHICALWQSVEEHDRNAQLQTIHAIAELIPLIPVEADKWLGASGRSYFVQPQGERRVRLGEDWRTGTIRVNSREHQEQLRAVI